MFKTTNLLVLFVSAFLAISCGNITVEDGDYAADVAGTYTITSAESSSSLYDDTVGDQIIVTRVDDTTADILLTFASAIIPDLELDGVTCSDASGTDVDLDKEYSNATVIGFVGEEDGITLRIEWDDGAFAEFTGTM